MLCLYWENSYLTSLISKIEDIGIEILSVQK